MDDILRELGRLSKINDNDLLDIINKTLESDDDDYDGEDDEFNPDKDYEIGETDILGDIDLVGKNYWENISQFGDKTKEIATQLILQFVEGTFGKSRSLPIYHSKPMKGDDIMELDIDTTIDRIIEEPGSEVIPWVFERQKTRNPVLLLMDTSFSMNGMKIMIAGIVTGVLSRLLPSKDLCIMGFARKPYYIKQFDEEVSTYYMINRIMKLLPRGPTNISEAMKQGSELIYPFHPHSKLIMLTDADPTAGKNPIPEAAKLHQLDLMLFPNGNRWMAERIVYEVNMGKLYKINAFEDIPEIINQIFSSI